MQFEIIDFHTHPFLNERGNICSHAQSLPMTEQYTVSLMKELGVSRIAGSVILDFMQHRTMWDYVQQCNDEALALRDLYGDFYIPGFHVSPLHVKESIQEIERMKKANVNLIGELVPYTMGWDDYACEGFSEILDAAEEAGMIVSFHSMGEDAMDKMVERHKNLVLIAAHPGELNEFKRHMERMKFSENYYLDVSGYGIFRHGMLRHAIDLFGAQRFLFGSDYPTCNPAMYIGGVLLDPTVTDAERKLIFSENAKRLLKL